MLSANPYEICVNHCESSRISLILANPPHILMHLPESLQILTNFHESSWIPTNPQNPKNHCEYLWIPTNTCIWIFMHPYASMVILTDPCESFQALTNTYGSMCILGILIGWFCGVPNYAVRGFNVVSERLFIQPMLWGLGCIYYRQVCLPIGFAWLCERW